MNWDEASDFEVNKRLVELLGLKFTFTYNATKGDFDNPVGLLVEYDVGGNWIVDYCNCWESIGPIIDKCDISIIKVSDGYIAIDSDWDYIDISCHDDMQDSCIGDECITGKSIKQKRAAAICAIKLLESEK